MTLPLVSALMITGKTPAHRRLAKVAVQCFHAQSYEARELIVINTAEDAPWFPGEPNVKECVSFGQTLGDLRNESLGLARGELCIQWDDDDWHHHDRIRYQVVHHSRGSITFLRRQYRLDIQTGEWGVLDAAGWPMGGIVGTVLHDRTDFRYPSLPRGEDAAFIRQWLVRNPLDNRAELYVRLFHGGNTWDRQKVMGPVLKEHRKFKGSQAFIDDIRKIYDGTN
jgi:hypothetical protein